MRLYFVRHGETKDNAARRYQNKNSQLSTLGIKQAHILAKRLLDIDIDSIYCSPQKRARETGLIINDTIKKPVVFTHLLSEIKQPTELEKKHKDNLDVRKLSQLLIDNFHNPSWRYSDEESYNEIKKRSLDFIEMIKPSRRQNILAISHNLIISAIVATLMFGAEVTSRELLRWMYFASMENAGISLCEYTDRRGWRLMSWNDHAHFEELY